jgi:hypothetical protein
MEERGHETNHCLENTFSSATLLEERGHESNHCLENTFSSTTLLMEERGERVRNESLLRKYFLFCYVSYGRERMEISAFIAD